MLAFGFQARRRRVVHIAPHFLRGTASTVRPSAQSLLRGWALSYVGGRGRSTGPRKRRPDRAFRLDSAWSFVCCGNVPAMHPRVRDPVGWGAVISSGGRCVVLEILRGEPVPSIPSIRHAGAVVRSWSTTERRGRTTRGPSFEEALFVCSTLIPAQSSFRDCGRPRVGSLTRLPSVSRSNSGARPPW